MEMEIDTGTVIGGYTIELPVHKRDGVELYRARRFDGRQCYFKLFTLDPGKAEEESALRKRLDHPGVCAWMGSGKYYADGKEMAYMVTEFFSGEKLSDLLLREQVLAPEKVRDISLSLLRVLRYLHSTVPPTYHLSISPETVMCGFGDDTSDVRLTDFCHTALDRIQYMPDSQLEGKDGMEADLFASGVLMYRMLFGKGPWTGEHGGDPGIPALKLARQKGLRLPAMASVSEESPLRLQLDAVIAKALSNIPEQRFDSADSMIKAILGKAPVEPPIYEKGKDSPNGGAVEGKHGNGFADVAGMSELKKLLNENVLYVLKNRERAIKYDLTIPNGMLLYGPPGCGKSFISERFAEEAGYKYKLVKSSDLASIYIHGTQEKIAGLFDEARRNAPMILCFDEFDAIASKRSSHNNAGLSGEVNELLSQLDNIGKDRVFVIATTNRPDMIDEAVLRKGRFDHIIYVPLPDSQAREELFRIHLKRRPCEDGIDYAHLSGLSERFVASEIAYVCNTAATEASHTDALISQQQLERIIRETTPRTTPDVLATYDDLRRQMEQRPRERKKIGF